jgi:hypothetical protein
MILLPRKGVGHQDLWHTVQQSMLLCCPSSLKAMVEQFYLNKLVQSSSALHGHFVDMHSAFKQAIHQLSLSPYNKKSPSVYVHGDPEVEEYLDKLDNLLQSGTKNFFQRSGGFVR